MMDWHKWPNEKPNSDGHYLCLNGTNYYEKLKYDKEREAWFFIDESILVKHDFKLAVLPSYWTEFNVPEK